GEEGLGGAGGAVRTAGDHPDDIAPVDADGTRVHTAHETGADDPGPVARGGRGGRVRAFPRVDSDVSYSHATEGRGTSRNCQPKGRYSRRIICITRSTSVG